MWLKNQSKVRYRIFQLNVVLIPEPGEAFPQGWEARAQHPERGLSLKYSNLDEANEAARGGLGLDEAAEHGVVLDMVAPGPAGRQREGLPVRSEVNNSL